MLVRESVYAILCMLLGCIVAVGTLLAVGGGPSPVIPLSIITIGIGAALVVVRYGRLGPYKGVLGTPSMELAIRDRIHREAARSLRYGGEFSVLALRPSSRRTRVPEHQLRAVDDVIRCWGGLYLILLPETSRDGAMRIHERISATSPVPTFAAVVTCPTDCDSADELMARLLTLVQSSSRTGELATADKEHDRVAAATA